MRQLRSARSRSVFRPLVLLLLCAVTLGGIGLLPAAAAEPKVLTGTIGQAAYRIELPATWNGTLVLYSHGYVAPGSPNPALAVSDPVTGAALLAQGYALVGTSYSTTGWALEQAFAEQIAVLDLFAAQVGTPKRTIAWGDSLGGMITAGLVQRNPERFVGALPLCGVLMGGVATWNGSLDATFAFKQLLAPQDAALQIVKIANPQANVTRALGLLQAAQGTPQGRARLALAAAFNQVPDWYDPATARPAATDYAARQRNQAAWLANPALPFAFGLRAEMEARAGGNPSFNVGVNYRELFARSADRDLVEALYAESGLDLAADLAAIDAAPRIAADPQALDYLQRYITFNGKLAVPVLTLHTLADGLVAAEGETAYRDVVNAAGAGDRLRQLFIERPGHCTFTPAERLTAFGALINRIDTGNWPDATLSPAALNAAATALGPNFNVLLQASGRPTVAAFTATTPAPFLRPFDARSTAPVPSPPPTGGGGFLPGLPNTGAGGGRREFPLPVLFAVSIAGASGLFVGTRWSRRHRAA
ncbi:MAG TPA: hypothetical protein VIL85_12315 [Thermomicrobiales bacterium]